MCSNACLDFGKEVLQDGDMRGQRVLEVGSLNVNGSMRQWVEMHQPAEYIGVDLISGPGVDKKLDAGLLVKEFGANTFDLVISTEMLEHVPDAKGVIVQMKRVLKPGGFLLITTRSEGFPFHEYPVDAWRFELPD